MQLASSTGASAGAIAEVARKFEAQALGALLQPMFMTVDPANNRFGGGAAEATWRPMQVDAIAKSMADTGGIGLAASVQAELLRAQENLTGAGA